MSRKEEEEEEEEPEKKKKKKKKRKKFGSLVTGGRVGFKIEMAIRSADIRESHFYAAHAFANSTQDVRAQARGSKQFDLLALGFLSF